MRRGWQSERPLLRDADFGGSSESDSKLISTFSASGETAHEEADAGDHDPGFGAGDGGLEVFCQAAVASKPGEAALNDPAFWLGSERANGLRSGDDFDRPFAQTGECIEELVAAVDAVGEDVP